MTSRSQIAERAGNEDIIPVQPVSGGWHRVIGIKWRSDFCQIIGHAKPHLAEANKPNTAVTHRILSLRKMTGGGAEMKPPSISLYRNFTLYIWRQLPARGFCISVFIQHNNLAGLFLFVIVLQQDRLPAFHKYIW